MADLLLIETQDFILTFGGPVPNPRSYALNRFKGGTLSEAKESNDLIHIDYDTPKGPSTLLRISSSNIEYSVNNLVIDFNENLKSPFLPLFFETIEYQVQLSPKSNAGFRKILLWHEHASILKNLTYHEQHDMMSGNFTFGNHVGYSEFHVKSGNRTLLLIGFTVFSLKLDFISERSYMLNDLSLLQNTLLYELFKPTKSVGISSTDYATGLEWMVNFYHSSEQIIKMAKAIEKKAHNNIQSEQILYPLNRVKKTNRSLNKRIEKYGKDYIFSSKNIYLQVKQTTINTPENKYLKHLMKQITSTFNIWVSFIETDCNERYCNIKGDYFYLSLHKNIKIIKQSLTNNFWGKISESTTIENKTNFMFHGEFVKFEKLCKQLKRAIHLESKGTKYIYLLSQDELYEKWALCKIIEILSGIIYGNDTAISVKYSTNAFRAVINSGIASKIKLNDILTISTNRLFTNDSTRKYFCPHVSQKPDFVFEIENQKILNIFDAKYKIEVIDSHKKILRNSDLINMDYSNTCYYTKPKDTDINTMHRYKDAILTDSECGVRKAVNIGVILYPYKPFTTELRSIMQNSEKIHSYKIGAIPLAPGKKDIKWIESYRNMETLLFDDTDEYEQIRILAYHLYAMLRDNGIQMYHFKSFPI